MTKAIHIHRKSDMKGKEASGLGPVPLGGDMGEEGDPGGSEILPGE